MASFDVVATYNTLLSSDPDLTMPIAAISSLIRGLAATPTTTVSETLDLVTRLTADLKVGVPNNVSLSAGTDLFKQYLIAHLRASGDGDDGNNFDLIRDHLLQNGELFVSRAKLAREQIAQQGRAFVREGDTVLTNGGSRVVGALLRGAAEAGGRGRVRFRVIYVVEDRGDGEVEEEESREHIAALRERNVPVATIPPAAVAHCLGRVTKCFVGAEGVVENGGAVSRMGTYQLGMLARAQNKPFYVVAESHKFVRLYPLGQFDLGVEQNVLDFKTAEGSVGGDSLESRDEGVADMDVDVTAKSTGAKKSLRPRDAVDYTPPHLISAIITENGVKLPSAVSEELIKIWN